MYKDTEYRILEQIYLNPGIHKNRLSKNLKLSFTAIENGLKKLKGLLIEEISGNQLKYYLNYNSRVLTAGLTVVEQNRLARLPYKIRTAISEFLRLLDVKPVIAVLFGSYAKGNATKKSDIDIFLVYSEKPDMKKIENRAGQVSANTETSVNPVYVSYKEFRKSFYDATKPFYKELKEGKIIIIGIEWWRLLESEKA